MKIRNLIGATVISYSVVANAQYLPGSLPDGSRPANLEEKISGRDIFDVNPKDCILKLNVKEVKIDSKKTPKANGTYPASSIDVYLWDRDVDEMGQKQGPLKPGDTVNPAMCSGNRYGMAVVRKNKSPIGHPIKVGEELYRAKKVKKLDVPTVPKVEKKKEAPKPKAPTPTPKAKPVAKTEAQTPAPESTQPVTSNHLDATPKEITLYDSIRTRMKTLSGTDDGYNLVFFTRDGVVLNNVSYSKGYEKDIGSTEINKPGLYMITTNDPGEEIILRDTATLFSESLEGRLVADRDALKLDEANSNYLAFEFKKPGVHYLFVRVKNKKGGEETDVLQVVVPESVVKKTKEKKIEKKKSDTGMVGGATISFASFRSTVPGRTNLRFVGEEQFSQLTLGYDANSFAVGLYGDLWGRSFDVIPEGRFRPVKSSLRNLGYRIGAWVIHNSGDGSKKINVRATGGFASSDSEIEFSSIKSSEGTQGIDGSLRLELPKIILSDPELGLYGDVVGSLSDIEQGVEGQTRTSFRRKYDTQAEAGVVLSVGKQIMAHIGFGHDSRYTTHLDSKKLNEDDLRSIGNDKVRDLTYATAPNVNGNYLTADVKYFVVPGFHFGLGGTYTGPTFNDSLNGVERTGVNGEVGVSRFVLGVEYSANKLREPKFTTTDNRLIGTLRVNSGALDDLMSWRNRRFRVTNRR